MIKKHILISIAVLIVIAGFYIIIKSLWVDSRDRRVLCPESITYGPVLERISNDEILIAYAYYQNKSLKIGDSFEVIGHHEEQRCELKNIGESEAAFECDMKCGFGCSGKYRSKFNVDISILKDITYTELMESDYGPLRRKYFEHKVYNCNLYERQK